MLSERQKQIVENWDAENEGDKEPIRQKLRKSLADIPYLRKLPPMEAREIVRSAISNYAEIDNKSRLSDRDKEYGNMNVSEQIVSEEMIVNERYARPFIINSISVLFNSVSESEFEQGFNEGIEGTARWWQEYDIGENWSLVDFIKERRPQVNKTSTKIGYTDPPRSDKERLARIFYFHSQDDLVRPELLNSFMENNIFQTDIEDVQAYMKDVEDYNSQDKTRERPSGPLSTTSARMLIEAKQVINKSREFAESTAHAINHPKNNCLKSVLLPSTDSSPPELDWMCRELIEIHREYLDDNGILPGENKIPEYPNVHIESPNESKLNL